MQWNFECETYDRPCFVGVVARNEFSGEKRKFGGIFRELDSSRSEWRDALVAIKKIKETGTELHG